MLFCPVGGFSQEELLKIWKGLFYCMWVQDEPLLQVTQPLCRVPGPLARWPRDVMLTLSQCPDIPKQIGNECTQEPFSQLV